MRLRMAMAISVSTDIVVTRCIATLMLVESVSVDLPSDVLRPYTLSVCSLYLRASGGRNLWCTKIAMASRRRRNSQAEVSRLRVQISNLLGKTSLAHEAHWGKRFSQEVFSFAAATMFAKPFCFKPSAAGCLVRRTQDGEHRMFPKQWQTSHLDARATDKAQFLCPCYHHIPTKQLPPLLAIDQNATTSN